jgi:hypothetical protein
MTSFLFVFRAIVTIASMPSLSSSASDDPLERERESESESDSPFSVFGRISSAVSEFFGFGAESDGKRKPEKFVSSSSLHLSFSVPPFLFFSETFSCPTYIFPHNTFHGAFRIYDEKTYFNVEDVDAEEHVRDFQRRLKKV